MVGLSKCPISGGLLFYTGPKLTILLQDYL